MRNKNDKNVKAKIRLKIPISHSRGGALLSFVLRKRVTRESNLRGDFASLNSPLKNPLSFFRRAHVAHRAADNIIKIMQRKINVKAEICFKNTYRKGLVIR